MSIKSLSQPSFADAIICRNGKGTQWLEEMTRLISWSSLAALFKGFYTSTEGAPAYPPLVMVKILLLQQWYCLSDEAIEAALDDRLSFRRFCGLPLDTAVPDHSTLWRFRQRLEKAGLGKQLFEEVNRQIEARGMVLKRGTLIDASIIPAAVNGPRGKTGELSDHDPQAGWTKKNGETTYGYKVHAAVDEESGIVRRAEVTSADLHDINMGPALVMGDEQAVYADKGYDSKAFRAHIEAGGAKACVMERAKPKKKPPSWLKWLNHCWGQVRSGVERSFATMKQRYGLWRMRYIGLARNGLHVHLIATAMNLKKMMVLQRRQGESA